MRKVSGRNAFAPNRPTLMIGANDLWHGKWPADSN
jgi:hypothetical protein